MTAPVDTKAPLQNFRVVGLEERTFRAAPEAPAQPAGTCWHCGQGIRWCVIARNVATGETVTVGTTCAERIGLDPAGLKRYLAERFAEEREARSAAARYAARAAAEAAEKEMTARHGGHGTESRYLAGCVCEPCTAVAPHGTGHRFNRGECVCGPCLDWAAGNGWTVREQPVLVDLAVGSVVEDARIVDGQYGRSWLIPSADRFVPYGRKRRQTVTSRGYTYATAAFLGYTYRDRQRGGTAFAAIVRVSDPVVDLWNEPVRTAP